MCPCRLCLLRLASCAKRACALHPSEPQASCATLDAFISAPSSIRVQPRPLVINIHTCTPGRRIAQAVFVFSTNSTPIHIAPGVCFTQPRFHVFMSSASLYREPAHAFAHGRGHSNQPAVSSRPLSVVAEYSPASPATNPPIAACPLPATDAAIPSCSIILTPRRPPNAPRPYPRASSYRSSGATLSRRGRQRTDNRTINRQASDSAVSSPSLELSSAPITAPVWPAVSLLIEMRQE